jgi:hypothetical protein
MCVKQVSNTKRPYIKVSIFDEDDECVFLESRFLPNNVPRRYCSMIARIAFEKARWFAENGTDPYRNTLLH